MTPKCLVDSLNQPTYSDDDQAIVTVHSRSNNAGISQNHSARCRLKAVTTELHHNKAVMPELPDIYRQLLTCALCGQDIEASIKLTYGDDTEGAENPWPDYKFPSEK